MFHSLRKLSKLEVLSLKGNDFSKGLPAVLVELTSLEVLSLEKCDMADLLPRYVHCNVLAMSDKNHSVQCNHKNLYLELRVL